MADKTVLLYDTTLRDGAQTEGVSFSLDDKLQIARRLDQMGFAYIEGGFPSSNAKDLAFFREMALNPLKNSRVTAFGMTRRAGSSAENDAGLKSLLDSEAPVVTLVGKSWDLHVHDALRVSEDENLRMIGESVAFIKAAGREVVYDAEHFFDGCKDNLEYAMLTLKAAADAGADVLVLCDTNGGSLPSQVGALTAAVKKRFGLQVGIHCHNDCGLAIANTLAAVESGASHVQGTINGLGERTGNADLCVVAANLQLKMDRQVLPQENMIHLTELSRFAYETCNMPLSHNQPYVGMSAFAHKGGMHASAVARNPRCYEHINPETVGNSRRILISELAGSSNVVSKARKFNVQDDKALMARLRDRVQELENEGYQFEAAEASFEMLLRREIGQTEEFFTLENYQLSILKDNGGAPITTGTVKVRINGQLEHHVAEGDGPVNALDAALRKALIGYYPNLAAMSLTDYKVRVINSQAATAASVRVIIESKDANEHWGTVGVSENIIDASWKALVDSIQYKLLKDKETKVSSESAK